MQSDPWGRGAARPGADFRRVRALTAPALLAVVLLLAGCATSSPSPLAKAPPTAEPILQDDAAPVEVLAVFLKTLVIGDCAAASELSTAQGFAEVGGFCGRIHVVNFAIVGDATGLAPDALTFATTLTIEGGGAVLPDGDHTIFFSLGRQPTGPWRVTGGGSEP